VDILKTYKKDEIIILVLYPYLAEKVDFIDCIPVLRKDLIKFTKEIELLNP